jgi:hypothetical protein
MVDFNRMTPAQISAHVAGKIAGQSRHKFAPPADAELAAIYAAAFEVAGGRVPKPERAKPERTSKAIVDGDGRLLRDTLLDPDGRRFLAAFFNMLDEEAARGTGRLSVRLLLELTRMRWTGNGMRGEYKVNNNIAGSLSRYVLLTRPTLRGRVELRGEADPDWADPSAPLPASPFRWFNPDQPTVPNDAPWITGGGELDKLVRHLTEEKGRREQP